MDFKAYIESQKLKLLNNSFNIFDEKEINYGYQFKVFHLDKKDIVTVNSYYSDKKQGYKITVSAKSDSLIKDIVEELLYKTNIVSKSITLKIPNWKTYGGCDEVGKGDFFGPIVAVCFTGSIPQKETLKKLGIQDSKKIPDKKIKEIALEVIKQYPNQYQTMILTPIQYNTLYDKFSQNQKNLNHMLAWMHGKNILDLDERIKAEGYIIDKFNTQDLVKKSLKGMDNISIVEFNKAESDIFVATASILARYFFLKAMSDMDVRYKFTFPKGAGAPVQRAISDFVTQYSTERLKEVSKTHFKMKNPLIGGS